MTDWLLNFPLGTLLGWFIDQFNSYGWGLLGFTVAIKIILLPLGLLQQRSTINQMKVRPQEEAIRKQCGADKMRANLEVSNLYKENGISAAAGCLPMLVQLPILFSLYKIIRMPLTYVVKLSASQISALDAALGLNLLTAERVSHTAEITIAEALFSNLPAMVDAGLVEPGIRTFSYNFLGMNLAEHPSLAFNMLLLVPIFSGLTAFCSPGTRCCRFLPRRPPRECKSRCCSPCPSCLSGLPSPCPPAWAFTGAFPRCS